MQAKLKADLVIRNAYLITMDEQRRVLQGGAVAISGRNIVGVGSDADIDARFDGTRTIDAGGAPVHPGFIECHMHASLQMVRGVLPDDMPEDRCLDDFYYPYWNAVTDEEENLGVILASLEMVRNGTTCFMEAGSVFEPSSAAEAAELVGIRALIGDAFIWDHPGDYFQGQVVEAVKGSKGEGKIKRAPQNLDEALAHLGAELKRNRNPDALVRGHVALWGMGTASDELLAAARGLADESGVVVNMHQSYSPADVEIDRRRFGVDPLIHFADSGFLASNVSFAHANFISHEESTKAMNAGTTLIWAPASSMIWGHGGTSHGPHADFKKRGGNVAFGSDSSNWSNDFDVFKQAYLAVLATREARGDRNALGAQDVFEIATLGGARAVGLESQIGSIQEGKRADLVIHTLDRPEIIPTTDMIRNLIYSARSKSVDTVVIDGKIILEGGEFVSLDEAALLQQINRAAKKTFERLDYHVETSWPVL